MICNRGGFKAGLLIINTAAGMELVPRKSATVLIPLFDDKFKSSLQTPHKYAFFYIMYVQSLID
jgi:hypothetical protein